jgi:hypothetical protein
MEIMSATVRQTNKQNKTRFEECHIASGMRPEKGHLAPEVTMANEIIWDKLHPYFCSPV